MPNDLADVTRAIAARYGRDRAKLYLAGRAFTAPREHVATATGALPPALVPSQAPLQPRKSSMRKKGSIRTQAGGDKKSARAGTDFDLASFTFGGGQDEPAAEQRRQRDEGRASVRSVAAAGRMSRTTSRSVREMLKELEE